MSRILVNVCLFLYILHQGGQVDGLKCLSCAHTPKARDCEVLKECGPHEVCFASLVVSEAGFVYREIGCRDTRKCSSISTSVGKRSSVHDVISGKRATSGDVIVCDECCDSAFCQAGLCGDQTYESDRGTVCFHCPDQLEAGECDRIVECGRDEGCFESLHTSPSGMKTIQTGCMLHSTCSNLQRANLTYNSGANGYHCFKCCAGDICNDSCFSNIIAPTKQTAATQPPTPGGTHCVDATDQATCSLAAAIVCGDPAKAVNTGCSHYCGFC